MSGECVCAKHRHAVSLADARSLYDEVSHKIDDNILSVKLIKNRHRVETVDEQTIETAPTIDVNCLDRYVHKTCYDVIQGNRCKKGCPKVNVIHNQAPAPKRPEEEMLVLKTIRQITPHNDMKHSLEVELKSPRNYIALAEPGQPPPIIIPREPVIARNDKLEKAKRGKPAKKKKKRSAKR